MRIGIQLDAARTLSEGVDAIWRAEAAGFSSAWKGASGFDSITQLALAGRETERIELGTAVLSVWQRHPATLAQQALTVQAACGGRFTLGLGLSHRNVIEGKLGFQWHPLRRMREFLTVLTPLMAGENVTFDGRDFRFDDYRQSTSGTARPAPVVVAAHGPRMLELAGRLADGTIVYFAGTRYLRDVVIPTITAAAHTARRPSPRILVGLPVVVTNREPEAVRKGLAPAFAKYDTRPSFRAILDADGSSRAVDTAVIGTESEVRSALQEYAAIGATDFLADLVADREDEKTRTYDFLASLSDA